MKSFRINARNIGLTYPQCEVPLNLILKELELKSKIPIENYVLVRENHSEGGKHVHVYLKYLRPLNIVDPTHMDLTIEGETYKGKYEGLKNPTQWLKYILKNFKDLGEGDILYSEGMAEKIAALGNAQPYYIKMLELAKIGKIKEAMNLYEKEAPSQFIKNWMTIEKSLKGLYMKTKGLELKYPLSKFNVPAKLLQTLREETNKTIVLVGKPGTGKTRFLIAFCKEELNIDPLVINNLDGLRFHNGQSVIILDDVAWPEDISREQLIKIVDSEDSSTLSIKHSSVFIGENTRRLISTNTWDFVQPRDGAIQVGAANPYNDEAVQRRIKVIILGEDQSLIPSFPDAPRLEDLNIGELTKIKEDTKDE